MGVFLLILKILGIILGCVALLLVILLLIPVAVTVDYRDKLTISAKILGIKLKLDNDKVKKTVTDGARTVTEEIKLTHTSSLLAPIKDTLAFLLRKIKVSELRITAIVWRNDPADLAIAYGRTQAFASSALAFFQNLLIIDIEELRIIPDFDRRFSEETHVHFTVSAGLLRVIAALVLFDRRLAAANPNKKETNDER